MPNIISSYYLFVYTAGLFLLSILTLIFVILKYYIFIYLLKASYVHDLFGKIQLAAANIAILRDMEIYRFIQNGNNFSSDDRMDIIHIFSREVEYSEDNLETLAEEFIFDDIFKSENIIKLFNFSY